MFFRYRRTLLTHKILDELEAVVDDDVAQIDVYLLSPDPGPGGETDGDSDRSRLTNLTD